MSSKNIWLPYTQMKTTSDALSVVSADGVRIHLEDGKELIDGIASWWSVCHGYNHPHIIKAMTEQIQVLPHVMFAGLSHQPAKKLSSRLAVSTGLDRVFFSDSGSTAVEVAMKMAVQYWINKNDKRKNKFVCFRNSYHGDTMGCMSLSDPEDGFHHVFAKYIPKQYVVDIPNDEYDFAEFDELLDGIGKTVAGVVIEPLVQCAGGMKFYSADILAEIHRICKKHELLFIADEIATGFGRTGSMFACEEAGIIPDIMCLGKALTGGYTGLAATLATEGIFEAFLSDSLSTALMHGPTYMANPLACTTANASLDLFETEPRLQQIDNIENQLRTELEKCRKLNNVADVRVKGGIGVIQLSDPTWDYIFALRKMFIQKGVWLRPFGDIVYIAPPFTISTEDLSVLTNAVYGAVQDKE